MGRLSKITPMTPSGVRTRWMSRPLGRSHSAITVPTGSGSAAISRRPVRPWHEALVGERQPIEEGAAQATVARGGEVFGIGGKHGIARRRRAASAAASRAAVLLRPPERKRGWRRRRGRAGRGRASARRCRRLLARCWLARSCRFGLHPLQQYQIIAVDDLAAMRQRPAFRPRLWLLPLTRRASSLSRPTRPRAISSRRHRAPPRHRRAQIRR